MKVPDGFTITQAVDPKLLSYPMFASFDSSGRLFVFESDGSTPSTEEMLDKPRYHVRLLEDTNADGIFDKSIIFADSLTFPKGGVFHNGSLYVTSPPEFLRLTDTNSDGVADKKEIIHTGWRLDHNAAILGGPFLAPDGFMYLTDARRGYDITSKEGKRYTGKGARIWRCLPDGSRLEPIVGGGFDNPVELVFLPSGETIGTMTYFVDPQGGQRDALMHWVEGGVYPKPHSVIAEDGLKLTGELMPVMTKLARVAPSGLMRYRGNVLGDGFHGNLFRAEFNTGRIMRSVISADGATFKTLDEPFVTSTKTDVHPTDVLQDANGTILVINTGGWFIAGCPLSRVAKTDIPGGIYRISRLKSKRTEDPRGRRIVFNDLSSDQLCDLAMDTRPVVSDVAIKHLVAKGDDAVAAVSGKLLSSADEEIRAAAVFILARIGSPSASTHVHAALNDVSPVVRTAAARMCGLNRDTGSVGQLKKLLAGDNLQVRRQAAIALGQIGDPGAANDLLKAAAIGNDRYTEHSLIYSLITLKNAAPIEAALDDSSGIMRKAAIIALDQMDGYKLDKKHIVPFLESSDAQLRATGIWVTLHHADWADVVVKFVEREQTRGERSAEPQMLELLGKFSTSPMVQAFVANRISDPTATFADKALMLNVISSSVLKEIPTRWVMAVETVLGGDDIQLKARALDVVQTRNLKQLNKRLAAIISDPGNSAALRLKALNARLSSDPRLSRNEFGMLMDYIEARNDVVVRQQASRLLSSAELEREQLLALTREIARADVHLLPNLAGAFKGKSDEAVGNAFVATLVSSPSKLDNLTGDDVHRILEKYPAGVQKSAEPLMNMIRQKNASRLSQLEKTDSSLRGGDISSGRKLFFGKAACSSCHAIGTEGNKFAPDLTNIGEIRSRHDILEAIMFPSASFAREYETSRIITGSNTYEGIVKEQLADAIVIETGPGAVVRVPRKEITAIEAGTVSLMPPGLDKQLSTQELADLVAYLASLPDGAGGTIGY